MGVRDPLHPGVAQVMQRRSCPGLGHLVRAVVRAPQEGADALAHKLPPAAPYDGAVIFKCVGDGRPYPAHDLGPRDWAALPPRPVRLDELVTTKDTLQLAALLDEDSTFFGDLFAHVVEWRNDLYLEDGLHRALRAALQQRHVLHARIYVAED